ncbi:MAG: hypothetical protein ABI662_09475 [Dermatophilaceae bacterium]
MPTVPLYATGQPVVRDVNGRVVLLPPPPMDQGDNPAPVLDGTGQPVASTNPAPQVETS